MRLLRPATSLLAVLLLAATAAAQKPAPRSAPPRPVSRPAQPVAATPIPLAPPTTGYLQGVMFDSVHGEPLAGALVQVEGTNRLGFSDSLGRFVLDSILPGNRRLLIDHALLDTLGITLVTPEMPFAANELTRTTVAVPSAEKLVELFCPPARRALGPGALVGRVREPDSDVAAVGARVSFVWFDPDPPGIPMGLKLKKTPRVRETTVAADGSYRLCGLPERYEGKLQAQRKDGGETAEVVITQSGDLLALRSMSVAPLPVVARRDTGAAPATPRRGSARVFGKVVNRNGAPIAGARVGLMGGSAATISRQNGDFVLDSLPAGTQALVVRQIGYTPTEVPVELSSHQPARVTVRLGAYVPELSPVEVVSRREEGLQSVGFAQRKRSSAGGYFISPEDVERKKPMQFSDLLRTVPGVRVTSQNGQARIEATRGSQGGCVTVFVDGAPWQQLEAGDLDAYVRPEEVAAVEVYAGSASLPAQFTSPGQNCSAVVVWTKTRVNTRRKH